MLSLVSREYRFTITNELDTDFLSYLRRRSQSEYVPQQCTDEMLFNRVDISLDDEWGDVVAGLAGATCNGTLLIDLIWVSAPLRGQGIGQELLHMAENIAYERDCQQVRLITAHELSYFTRLGYRLSTQMNVFPSGKLVYWLEKPLTAQMQKDTA